MTKALLLSFLIQSTENYAPSGLESSPAVVGGSSSFRSPVTFVFRRTSAQKLASAA